MNKLFPLFSRVRSFSTRSHEKIILKKDFRVSSANSKIFSQQKFRISLSVILIILLSTSLFPITFAACQGPACAALKNQYTPPSCGDKKITPPETCDPPDTLCKDADNWPGLCSTTCTCVPYKKPRCGNLHVEQGEECEKNADCTSKLCNNCTCTAPLVVNAPEQNTAAFEQPLPTQPVQEEPVRHHEIYQPLGFNESIGIQVSYVVASFGHAMWNWITELWE